MSHSNSAAPAATAELAAIDETLAKVAARTKAATDARAAAAESPTTMVAAKRIELARQLREAAVAEHELAADAIYLDACLAHGDDRVARVETRYGSIVFRAPTHLEIDAADARAAAHLRTAKAAKTSAEADMHRKNATTAMETSFADQVLTDKRHFERVTTENPGLWPALWSARRALIDAQSSDEGKGGAR